MMFTPLTLFGIDLESYTEREGTRGENLKDKMTSPGLKFIDSDNPYIN